MSEKLCSVGVKNLQIVNAVDLYYKVLTGIFCVAISECWSNRVL